MKKAIIIGSGILVFLIVASFIYKEITFRTITDKCVYNEEGEYNSIENFDACLRSLTLQDKVEFGAFNLSGS